MIRLGPVVPEHPSALQLRAIATPEGLVVELTGPSTEAPASILRAPSLETLKAGPSVLWTGVLTNGRTNISVALPTLGGLEAFFQARWEPALDNPDPERWAWVPPGSFLQGSTPSEDGHESDESPSMRVVVRHGFLMGRHEVTQGEFSEVMGSNPSLTQGPDLPVHRVSSAEAMEYCERLTAIEKAANRLPANHEYRLPTEAEWEYAARAGTQTAYSFGNDPGGGGLSEHGWHAENSENRVQPVGLKQSNPWGIHDAHGNVSEWCLDFYSEYLGGVEVDPRGPASGEFRVIRGGSFRDDSAACRSAFRRYEWLDERQDDVGFRVVLAPVGSQPPVPVIELAEIPSGVFRLGSPASEVGHQRDEQPGMEITFRRGFHMSRHEITQAQYQEVINANPSAFQTGQGNRPVDSITWLEATEFCRRLTEREKLAGALPEGFSYRLPTEAEWEYAARAGTTNRYHFGDDPDHRSYPAFARTFTSGKTFNVGGLGANAWGLFDMHGNVAEWCADYADLYSGGRANEPEGPLDSAYRVVRGGGFSDHPEFIRSATRWSYLEPGSRLSNVGFRIVLARTERDATPPMEWVEIAPGTFPMGSPNNEAGRDPDEGPVALVTLTERYFIARDEITQAQYQEIMGVNPSFFPGPLNRPVERVSWREAMEFCRRLTVAEKAANRVPEGYECRLPTEAEWEFAARAGTNTRYSFVADPTDANLSHYASFLAGPTSGVGTKLPNPWGLHDVHGNVREWCLDWYGTFGAEPSLNPRGPAEGQFKVLRGGAWADKAAECRSAARGAIDPEARHPLVGFRVVLGPAMPEELAATR